MTFIDLIIVLLFMAWALVQVPWNMIAHALVAKSETGYQSKQSSLIEQGINTGSGFFLSLVFWSFVIAPLWDLDVTFVDNVGITAAFTFLSIARGYVIRRVFNWLIYHFGG